MWWQIFSKRASQRWAAFCKSHYLYWRYLKSVAESTNLLYIAANIICFMLTYFLRPPSTQLRISRTASRSVATKRVSAMHGVKIDQSYQHPICLAHHALHLTMLSFKFESFCRKSGCGIESAGFKSIKLTFFVGNSSHHSRCKSSQCRKWYVVIFVNNRLIAMVKY